MRIIQQVNQITMKVMKKEILHCSPGGEQNQNTCATGLNEASSTIERVSVIGATKRQHCTLQFSIDWKEYSEIMPASETACRFTSGSLAWIRDPVIETSTLTLWLGTGSSLISKTTAMQLSTLQFVRPTQNRVLFFQESFLLNLLPVNAKGHIAYCLWKCLYINSVHSLVKRQAVSEAGMISLYSFQSI